jgi:DNA polymerase (family 10)
MEINAYPTRLDLDDVNARAAKEMGVKMSIDSDAHEPEQLRVMKYGVNVARRGWLEKEDLLNAMSLQELMKVLKR